MITPEVSAGYFELKMRFIDWDQELFVFAMSEHIVEAITEIFTANLIDTDDFHNIKTITLINIDLE